VDIGQLYGTCLTLNLTGIPRLFEQQLASQKGPFSIEMDSYVFSHGLDGDLSLIYVTYLDPEYLRK
jgi:hypothetical protein